VNRSRSRDQREITRWTKAGIAAGHRADWCSAIALGTTIKSGARTVGRSARRIHDLARRGARQICRNCGRVGGTVALGPLLIAMTGAGSVQFSLDEVEVVGVVRRRGSPRIEGQQVIGTGRGEMSEVSHNGLVMPFPRDAVYWRIRGRTSRGEGEGLRKCAQAGRRAPPPAEDQWAAILLWWSTGGGRLWCQRTVGKSAVYSWLCAAARKLGAGAHVLVLAAVALMATRVEAGAGPGATRHIITRPNGRTVDRHPGRCHGGRVGRAAGQPGTHEQRGLANAVRLPS